MHNPHTNNHADPKHFPGTNQVHPINNLCVTSIPNRLRMFGGSRTTIASKVILSHCCIESEQLTPKGSCHSATYVHLSNFPWDAVASLLMVSLIPTAVRLTASPRSLFLRSRSFCFAILSFFSIWLSKNGSPPSTLGT